MHPPGLSTPECRRALAGYRLSADRLTRENIATEHARLELTALRSRLDDDVRARATLEAQSRMTHPETVVLEPALREMRITLQSADASSAAAVAARLSRIAQQALERLASLDAPH